VAAQSLSIPLLTAALWPAFGDNGASKKGARLALAVCAAAAIVASIQVIPLPFDVWSGRGGILPQADEARLAGGRPSWSTLSMTPQATWAAAVSCLVPLSIFGAALQLDLRQRLQLCWVLLAAGAVSLVLGFLQVAEGQGSALRFYEFTNPTEAVGFFANRNHLAAFLNVTLVLAALWLTETLKRFLEEPSLNTKSVLGFAAAGAFFVAVVAGVEMTHSRAGAALGIAALAGAVLMIVAYGRSHRSEEKPLRKLSLSRVFLLIAVFAAAFALQFGSAGVFERLQGDPADDLRLPLNATTFETAFKTLPFGTGLGSFVPVYATVEKRNDVIESFVNRAHDDVAELFLETGLLGVGLCLVFIFWFGRRVYEVWIRPEPQKDGLQAQLERVSCLVVALLLFHSLVDYPLRTGALAAVFALFCGFLAVPVNAPAPI
jgi:O-antigen ligase